jgi:hypothetical protein|tara:strand:- start:99 stop:368 length:270 start_codon:yes stop_codon:yes gene_type:complete
MQETRLVKELDKNIPFDKITVKMLKGLDYGMDMQLDENFSLSKHSEEEMIDIFHTETWTDMYAVSWNWNTDKDDSIEFEQVYHDKEEVF